MAAWMLKDYFFTGVKCAFPVLKPTFSESGRSGEEEKNIFKKIQIFQKNSKNSFFWGWGNFWSILECAPICTKFNTLGQLIQSFKTKKSA